MASREETTPLFGRRKQAQQQKPQRGTDEDYDDKQDRRPVMGRLSAALSSIFSPVMSKGGPATPLSAAEKEVTGTEEENYYEDPYNDYPWRCSFGTHEDDGIWMNRKDQAGVVMSFLVWILIIYSGVTVTLLAHHNHLPGLLAMFYCTICSLALASHAKTTFTDPGSVPQAAAPPTMTKSNTLHAMCTHCQGYKPPCSHHCRICNRCISRMDHHCPWMNNCIGIGNLKHFILFLCYTWVGAVFALLIFAWNYFLCTSESCTFNVVLIQLVRAMTFICIGSLLFTSSMLMNVTYGIMTGIGTIDRLKKKASNTMVISDDEPVPLEEIFGIQGYWTWWLPIDPVFQDYDKVLGFSTPQRLLRERQRVKQPSSPGMDSKGYSQV